MLVVLDKDGTIYHRLWCVFELYYATVALPKQFGRHLTLALANEEGVLTSGNVSMGKAYHALDLMRQVNVANARASESADSIRIWQTFTDMGVRADDLNIMLKDMARGGMLKLMLKAGAPGLVSCFPYGPINTTSTSTLALLKAR